MTLCRSSSYGRRSLLMQWLLGALIIGWSLVADAESRLASYSGFDRQDLLHPRWKGRLGIEAGDHEWMSAVIKDMGEDAGLRFFQDLVRSNGLSVRTGHPLLTNLTSSGEVPLALTVYQYSVAQAKKKGAPIEWFAIEPAIAIPDGIAIARKAPSPNAALLFYDYMLSPEAQRIVARIGYVPTSTRVDSPLKGVKLKLLDAATLLDEQERSMARFEEILRSK